MLFTKLQNLKYSLQRKILSIFGDIKIFKFPFFFIYDPEGYKLKGKHFEKVCHFSAPFNVVLRRYDAYLDNGFIEGFWNHAGVMEGPWGSSFGTVVHSIAEGVVRESLFDFCKADHICVLTPKFKFDDMLVATKLSSYVGRPYDFNFNPNTPDKLFCTELVRNVFDGFDHKIPVSTTYLGRPTILPDSFLGANFQVLYDSRLHIAW